MVEFDYSLTKKHCVISKLSKKRYYSQLELLTSKEKFNDLILITEDGQWNSIDWTEPEESFKDLCFERCRQLRDKYDWLTLYFSGGSDSETVLQSFIHSGVHLDEVVTNVFKIKDDDPPLPDVELAVKKLKSYSALIPKTKITINNLSRDVFLKFNKKQMWIDSTFNGTIGNFRRMTLPVLQELGQKVVLPNTRIGHIFAENKPHLIKKEDGYYAVWATNIGVGQWADWFFTSLDLPKLHIKQCYMVKNYFKKHNHTETIISEVGEVREQVIRACRFDFNNDFQPVKTTGLINDYKNLHSEDGKVIAHLKKYDKELFDIYTDATVKSMVRGASNKTLLDRRKGSLRKINSEMFFLGN